MKEQPSAILFFFRTSLNKAGFSPATSAFGPWPAAYTEAFRRTRLKKLWYPAHYVPEVVVAEWLRRWTRNPLGSPRAGSNPADYDSYPFNFLLFHATFYSY